MTPSQTRHAGELRLVADLGEAAWRYVEFFTANIRNPHTRRAYARACNRFFGWCEDHGCTPATIRAHDVVTYIEQLQTTRAVKLFPLPEERRNANLNTATVDRQGVLWFTGQNGIYGRLDPKTGAMAVFDAPRGTGPYGIATTPDGQVFFASLAGNYLGQIDLETGGVTVLEPPVPRQGARRVWSDSHGALWITGWNSGDLFRYDSKAKTWARWRLPGDGPQPYAVYVDETDMVWVSDWGANAILRFDPKTEKFEPFLLPDGYAGVRQLAGRKGEVWGAESGADKLFVLKAESRKVEFLHENHQRVGYPAD
jgi:streptogramin lyase